MRFALACLYVLGILRVLIAQHLPLTNNDAHHASNLSALDPTRSLGPGLLPHAPPKAPSSQLLNVTLPASPDAPNLDPRARNGLFLQHPAVAGDLDGDKHFVEATFDNHYDGRFASGMVGHKKRLETLHRMIRAYLTAMRDVGVETWLMHGTLLGWWWNKRILRWDEDVDVQMTTESLGWLGRNYNMSVWNFDREGGMTDSGGAMAVGWDGTESEFGKWGSTYVLEINPYHVLHNGGVKSDKNVIDGRWIDTTTGLYVDITCLWKAVDHEAGSGILTGKDGHSFREKYIFPLRETTFEGVEALIPNAYMEVLSKEYGPMALVKTHYTGHVFDGEAMEWVLVKPNATIDEAPENQEE